MSNNSASMKLQVRKIFAYTVPRFVLHHARTALRTAIVDALNAQLGLLANHILVCSSLENAQALDFIVP